MTDYWARAFRKDPSLNDLDFCVVAVVARDGPTSVYRVRERFRTSMTSTWSSSAGTIYPAVQRLLKAEYIAAGKQIDRRGTQLLEVTGKGRAALIEWLGELPSTAGPPTADPVRTRLQYAAILGPQRASEVVRQASGASQESLAAILERLSSKADENWFDYLATLGSALQVRARLEWLQLMNEGLQIEAPGERAEFVRRVQRYLTTEPWPVGKP